MGLSDDLIRRHLARTGNTVSVHDDAWTAASMNVLRAMLRLVEMAHEDEDVAPDVTRRVLERVIYGAVPTRADVEARLQVQADLGDVLRRQPAAMVLGGAGRADDRLP